MRRDAIIRAWAWLMGLSAGSTLLAWLVPGLGGTGLKLAGAAILLLAWSKARIILSDYLGLRTAPFWRRGFGLVLGLYMVTSMALFAAG